MKLNNKNRQDFLKEFKKDLICAELGVFNGTFSKYILEIMKPRKLYLIDSWRLSTSIWSGTKTEDLLNSVKDKFKNEKCIKIYEKNDVEFLPSFPDNFFDWIYLDTTHTYAHTKSELEILKNKIEFNGTIAGHDWYEDENHKLHGVCKAVKEFLNETDFKLVFLDNHSQWAIRRI